MFRSPIPNAEQAILENIGSAQLITLFESCLKTGLRGTNVRQLAEAWGTLFSNHYLSAEELVDEMQRGEQRLGARNEQILKEFVKADCRSGGVFVLNVIKKGGNIDRAALIMIADLEDLAGIDRIRRAIARWQALGMTIGMDSMVMVLSDGCLNVARRRPALENTV